MFITSETYIYTFNTCSRQLRNKYDLITVVIIEINNKEIFYLFEKFYLQRSIFNILITQIITLISIPNGKVKTPREVSTI